MAKRSDLSIKKKILFLIPAGISALLVLFSSIILSPFLVEVNTRFTDQLFRLRSQLRDDQEFVYPYLSQVYLSDACIERYNLAISDRKIYGEIVAALSDFNVRSIGFDIIFQYPGDDRGEDIFLIDASLDSGKIYFPVKESGSPGRVSDDFLKDYVWYPRVTGSGNPRVVDDFVTSFEALAVTGKGVGHINIPLGVEKIHRKIPLLFSHENGYIPALSFAMVCDYFQVEPEDIWVEWGKHIILKDARSPLGVVKNIVIPIDSAGNMVINVPARWQDSSNFYSFSGILTSDGDRRDTFMNELEDSLVIVSDLSSWSKDFGEGILDLEYPLSVLHSQVMNTIIMEDFLYPQWGIWGAAAVLLLFLIPFVCFYRFNGVVPFVLTIAAVLIFIFCQSLVFLLFHSLPDIGLGLLSVLFSFITASLFYARKQEAQKPVESTVLPTASETLEVSIDDDSEHVPVEIASVEKKPVQHVFKTLKHPESFERILTKSVLMNHLFSRVEDVAESAMPVLITGETGVGKNMIPEILHSLSGRKGKLVVVNIAGLDDTMFSDSLFGHTKGAFTGAGAVRRGLIEEAQGGTLFLDEIGDLEPASQVKLLDLIQNNRFYPLGADKECVSDARIIAATNAGLKEKIKEGTFREDLFYRLIYHLEIPSLRERLDDLPMLVEHFFEQAAFDLEKKKPRVSAKLISQLKTYHFPGNIRELQKMVFESMSRHKSKAMSLSFFEEYIKNHEGDISFGIDRKDKKEIVLNYSGKFPSIKETTSILVDEALKQSDGHQSMAAGMLGITPSALSRRLKGKSKKKDD